MTSRRLNKRLTPLAVAAMLALGSSALQAAPQTSIGPGSFGDIATNWSGGLPGAAADALLGAFNTEVRTSFTINSFTGTGTGTMTVSAGTLSFASASTTGGLNLTGSGSSGGTGSVTVANGGTWAAGQMNGTGSTTINGPLAMTGNGNRAVVSRTVIFNGTTTWSNLSAGSGIIQTGSGATLANAGTWLDQNAFGNSISNDFGGAASTFVNTGTYRKTGVATTGISIGFNNTGGTVQVEAGSLNLATLSNFAITTLTGGTYSVFGPSTLQFAGANVVTNAATIRGAGVEQRGHHQRRARLQPG